MISLFSSSYGRGLLSSEPSVWSMAYDERSSRTTPTSSQTTKSSDSTTSSTSTIIRKPMAIDFNASIFIGRPKLSSNPSHNSKEATVAFNQQQHNDYLFALSRDYRVFPNAARSAPSSGIVLRNTPGKAFDRRRISQRPCRDFLKGRCTSRRCRYRHDLAAIPCKFWAKGECFNVECKFAHC